MSVQAELHTHLQLVNEMPPDIRMQRTELTRLGASFVSIRERMQWYPLNEQMDFVYESLVAQSNEDVANLFTKYHFADESPWLTAEDYDL